MSIIYLDHAATTKLDERVLDKMMPYLTDIYGNANSVHQVGRKAVDGLDEARDIIAKIIGSSRDEIYFTSGGTEGNNWIIRELACKNKYKGSIVTSSIEHSSISHTLEYMEERGVEVIKVKPNENGFIDVNEMAKAVKTDTFLVILMHANNEIGTIQDTQKLRSLLPNMFIHVDTVQTIGQINFNVKTLGASSITCSSHKFNGPKGVGFVYLDKKYKGIEPLISGGYQESKKRGGTSNVAGCVGLAEALRINRLTIKEDSEKITNLRNYFIDEILNKVPGTKLNGDKINRLPNNANIQFSVNGEKLLYNLDRKGICASLGAACSAGSIEPSKVLIDIGLTKEEAASSIRFTFGRENTKEEVDFVVNSIIEIHNQIN